MSYLQYLAMHFSQSLLHLACLHSVQLHCQSSISDPIMFRYSKSIARWLLWTDMDYDHVAWLVIFLQSFISSCKRTTKYGSMFMVTRKSQINGKTDLLK